MTDVRRFPALAGRRLRSDWIRANYPISVPFKDFARELSKLMRKVRVDEWHRGRRVTATLYVVPPANVVPLEASRRG